MDSANANAGLGIVHERGLQHSDDKDYALCIDKLLLRILQT